MPRVQISSQGWGTLLTETNDGKLRPYVGAAASIKNLDGSAATIWSASTGGTGSTGSINADSSGALPGYLDPGTYLFTVGSQTIRVEVTSGSGLGSSLGVGGAWDDVADYLDFKGLAIVFPGSNGAVFTGGEPLYTPASGVDDLTRLTAAMDEAQSKFLPLFIPFGSHRVSAGVQWESQDGQIFGLGSGLSRLMFDSSTPTAGYGLRIGPDSTGGPFSGPGDIPRGYAHDFSVWAAGGPDHLDDATDTTAAGIQLSKTNWDMERLQARGWPIAFDMLGNCYGTRWASCWAKYGWNHIGLLIRTGDQNGQDITYDNCWLSGRKVGVLVEPYTAGQHFRGGQISAGASNTTADHDNYGALTLGLGNEFFIDGTVTLGATRNFTFHGVNFEGTDRCWEICAYEPHHNYVFQAVHFMGHGDIQGSGAPNAAALAQAPLGIMKWVNPYVGTMTFDSCFVGRYFKGVQYVAGGAYPGTHLIFYDGVQNDALRVVERGTVIDGATYVNNPGVPYISSGRAAQGFGYRGVWANDGVPHQGEGSFGELQLGALRLRGSADGSLVKSVDYGVNWSAV